MNLKLTRSIVAWIFITIFFAIAISTAAVAINSGLHQDMGCEEKGGVQTYEGNCVKEIK